MRARVIHAGADGAGVPLTRVFNRQLQVIREEEAKDPEVQNRYQAQLEAAKRGGRMGPTLSFSGNEANPLFHNTGRGFQEIGTTLGLSRREDGRGVVVIDLNGDGSLDVVLHNHFRNPLVALLNRAPTKNGWARFRFRGTTSNRFGIGACVRIGSTIQELQCGSGFLSANAPELHFGLGAREMFDAVVRWPSGKEESYEGLAAGRIYTFTEGDPGKLESRVLKPVTVKPGPEAASGTEPDVRSVLGDLKELDGQPAPIREFPDPVVAVFFSEACHACRGELLRQAEVERRAKESGVRLVWITVDRDVEHLKGQLRHIGAPVMPLRPGKPLEGISVPSVYRVTKDGVEKFVGRHAVTAALESPSRP